MLTLTPTWRVLENLHDIFSEALDVVEGISCVPKKIW